MSNALNTIPHFKKEFPDFPIEDVPAMPSGFDDVSWHNDSCPSFLNEKAGLIVFVDYRDVSLREIEDGATFTLNVWDNGTTTEVIAESNDWADILLAIASRLHAIADRFTIDQKIALAREFGSEIQGALTRAEFGQLVDRNKAEPADSNVCHSHDFCDANLYMLEAFQTVFGREPAILTNANDEVDARLWSDAWAIAKAADFFA